MPEYQKTAYLFPGQGAQYPGIGKDLYDQLEVVRATYTEASDALVTTLPTCPSMRPPKKST